MQLHIAHWEKLGRRLVFPDITVTYKTLIKQAITAENCYIMSVIFNTMRQVGFISIYSDLKNPTDI